jgi:hypothetical protein
MHRIGARSLGSSPNLMVRIAITKAAFDAIAKTLPRGSVGYENKVNEKGERLIWLEPSMSIGSGPCEAQARATAT